MSPFTKIRESRRARKQRRLATKLHKMIEAAAAENDGTLALQCDMILQGDLFARGDIGARHDLYIGGGIHTDGDLDAKKITANEKLIAASIYAEETISAAGDIRTKSEMFAVKSIRTNGYCISGGALTVGGDAHVNGRARFDRDITASGHVRTLGAVAAVGSVVALGEVSAYGCGLEEARETVGVDVDNPGKLLRGFDDFLDPDGPQNKVIG